MKTVSTYSTRLEADLAKLALDSAGIPSVVIGIGVGMHVAEMLARYLHTFVNLLEPTSVNTHAIRRLLDEHKERKEAMRQSVADDDIPF